MNDDSLETEPIEKLLRQLPERDVPPGLHERIIGSLPLGPRPQGIASKLRACWDRLGLIAPMPLKAGAILAMTAAAFWLGTEVGARRGMGNLALVADPAGMPSIAGEAGTGYRLDPASLDEETEPDTLDFTWNATLPEHGSARKDRWSDIFLNSGAAPGEERRNSQAPAGPGVDSTLFLLNLAHNLADSGNYQGALQQYEKVLRLNPLDQTALYNRATSYHHLKDQDNERLAFIGYLEHYRSGRLACQAVDHLQRLGVFDYQICMIGGRKVVVNQAILLDSPQSARQLELKRLAPALRRPFGGELHVVVFYRNDLEKSRAIAMELKQQLSAILGGSRALPIRTSWFDEPAPVQTAAGEKRELETGLFLFTQPSTQQRSTI